MRLNSSAFPDSITFFLPITSGDSFDINNAVLLEEVRGWIDSCEFSFTEYGAPESSNFVIIEDISASMGDYVHFTDKLIWGYVSTLTERECEVSLVRFGENVDRTIDWVSPDSFLSIDSDSLPYPNPGGSDLPGALDLALDLVSERLDFPATVVLFSDGDFEVNDLPERILKRAAHYDLSINIFMHGQTAKGALSEVSNRTEGVYLVQPPGGFSPGMIDAIMDRSYYIVYRPKHIEKNAALHIVNLCDTNGHCFHDKYRAPGEPVLASESDIEPEPLYLPDELLYTRCIPFRDPGNDTVLPEGMMVLDAIAAAVNSLPDTLNLVLDVRGYACNLGPTGANMRLSKKRAYAVRDYLSPRVNGNATIDVSWFGEMYPLNPNANEQQRRENRRVEISLQLRG